MSRGDLWVLSRLACSDCGVISVVLSAVMQRSKVYCVLMICCVALGVRLLCKASWYC